MKKRCRKTLAVQRVSCGNLSMMPTWMMKLQPLERDSRSFWAGMPASMEGVRRSSAGVNSHCDSARRRSSLGRDGGAGRKGEPVVEDGAVSWEEADGIAVDVRGRAWWWMVVFAWELMFWVIKMMLSAYSSACDVSNLTYTMMIALRINRLP